MVVPTSWRRRTERFFFGAFYPSLPAAERTEPERQTNNQTHRQVQWKTKTLAILHVGCFGVSPARRAEVMANLREQIWRAGGLVATPQSETGSAAADDVSANNSTSDQRAERAGGAGRSGEEGAAIEGEPRASMLPLTRTASDGGRAILPPAASTSSASSSMVTAARGGGVMGSTGGGGDCAGGRRPELGPRTPSVSAALTQKEGLIHKVNAGLSGLETSIFFQLMLPESPPHPEAGRVVPSRASAIAAPVLGQRPGPYPTFCGGASKDLVAAPEDQFAGLSKGRHVASYLRRQRWLWSFACPDAPSFGGAFADGVAVAGSDGGCDSAEWTTCRKKIINSLARSRRADGFVLVDCQDNEALMVKGVRIMLGVLPGEGGGHGGDARGSGGGGGRGEEAGAKAGNDGEQEGARKDAAVHEEDAGHAGEDRGKGGGGDGGGGGSSDVGDGAGAQQPDGNRQGEPRAMRMILQYRVFEVSVFSFVGFACSRVVVLLLRTLLGR